MNNIISTLSNVQPYIVIGLSIIVFILLIIVLLIFKSLNKLEIKYRKLTRGVNNKNLEEIIVGYLDNIDEIKLLTENIRNEHKQIEDKIKGCVQKVSMLRYKAFEDVGSDLSFSVALLDYNNDGIILTGIYGRNDSTVYAKPIDKGISRYDLSEEEEEVLNNAIKQIYN
jgi:hypothetical protein